jgi:hypothetical protein
MSTGNTLDRVASRSLTRQLQVAQFYFDGWSEPNALDNVQPALTKSTAGSPRASMLAT